MSDTKIKMALMLAASMNAFNTPANPEYSQRKEKQRAEQAKALEKKQRVREEIRARKQAKRLTP